MGMKYEFAIEIFARLTIVCFSRALSLVQGMVNRMDTLIYRRLQLGNTQDKILVYCRTLEQVVRMSIKQAKNSSPTLLVWIF